MNSCLRILVDTPALNSPTGSGIKTYTLNVLRAQALAGLQSELLYEVPRHKDVSLNELYAGQFARDKEPSLADYARHVVKTFGGIASTPLPLKRSPGLVGSQDNRPEYHWLSGLPSRTYRHIYELARVSHEIHGRFTVMNNPRKRIDLWHATFQRPLFLKSAKNIVTIHDLIPLRLPGTNPEPKKEWFKLASDACKRSDHVLATSHHTKKDLLEFLRIPEEKISVVYQAPDPVVPVSPEDSEMILHNLDLQTGNYFLFVGNIEPRKNIRRLIQAWSRLEDRPPLVVAGQKAWLWEDELSRIPAGADIRFLGYVSLEEKSVLYRNALCLLFPSLYEGFGLPPLEAMASGLPVITSPNSSLAEVCGNAAYYVDPYDVKEMATAMQRLRENSSLRTSMIEKGKKQAARFSLEHFSADLKKTYEQVLGSSERPAPKTPKSLAVVTLAVGDKAQKLLAISRSRIKAYAEKVQADYHEIDELLHPGGIHLVCFSKLKIRDFLDRYDRVLYVDSDILISPETPDIFQAVPESHFGACLENFFVEGYTPISLSKEVLGDVPGWTSGYFNAGVMVISQAHKQLFDPIAQPPDVHSGKTKIWDDQIYLNWKLRKLNIPLFELDTRYNWTPGHSETPQGRFLDPKAWLVHFCSEGFEYTRTNEDDHYSAKYHQMICWNERLKGRHIHRFHPDRFYPDKGLVDRSFYPVRMTSGTAVKDDRVCYGPYYAMEDGYYRFSVKPKFTESTFFHPQIKVILCAERGKRPLFDTRIGKDPGSQTFHLYLEKVDDLEICFYGAGTGYSFEYVEVEKLA